MPDTLDYKQYLLETDKNFDNNYVPSFQAYTMIQSLNQDNTVTLAVKNQSGTSINCSLSENGLDAHEYRKLRILFRVEDTSSSSESAKFTKSFNTGSKTNKSTIVVRIRYDYYDNGVLKHMIQEIPFSPKNIRRIESGDDIGYYEGIKILPYPNVDAQLLGIYIINNMSTQVRVKKLELLQSQDIYAAQTSTSINYGVGLKAVDAFDNGCKLKFFGQNDPTVIEYHADANNNFDGVYVDSVLFIPFTRHPGQSV